MADVVAVIGAGNVGCALAGDLALQGIEVRLFNRSPERLRAIGEAGGIALTGEIDGIARLALMTDSLAAAVDGAEVVALTVPTVSLPSYAAALAKTTTPEQVIWLNPGHSGGALFLAAELDRSTAPQSRKLCQLTTASHICRMTGPATVRVFLRARASVAALPSTHLDECHERLAALLGGELGRCESILEADLANVNALLHPPGMICNAGWIEATNGDFGFYAQGTSPAVAGVIEAIDRERLELAQQLGVRADPFPELFAQLGFVDRFEAGPDAYSAVHASWLIDPIRAPAALDHRYLHEDIGWSLVPWMHLAEAVHCPTPTINSLINLANAINRVDYSDKGLTLERMGLHDKCAEQIRDHVGTPNATI
jgi:opine dehydrogenase